MQDSQKDILSTKDQRIAQLQSQLLDLNKAHARLKSEAAVEHSRLANEAAVLRDEVAQWEAWLRQALNLLQLEHIAREQPPLSPLAAASRMLKELIDRMQPAFPPRENPKETTTGQEAPFVEFDIDHAGHDTSGTESAGHDKAGSDARDPDIVDFDDLDICIDIDSVEKTSAGTSNAREEISFEELNLDCENKQRTLAALNTISALMDRFAPATAQGQRMQQFVQSKIMHNDYCGLRDFIQAIRRSPSVEDEWMQLLNNRAATWLHNLGRLHAYASVTFIHRQFEDAGADCQGVHRAYLTLCDELARFGITLDCPRLFEDKFDPLRHTPEPIKNITELVGNLAEHVDDTETIVDVFTLGYKKDGVSVEKPAVSRLNS